MRTWAASTSPCNGDRISLEDGLPGYFDRNHISRQPTPLLRSAYRVAERSAARPRRCLCADRRPGTGATGVRTHPTRTPLGRWAIDEFGAGYVSWREECQAVWLAYERWSESDRGDRGLAHAAYVAALDRE